MPCCPARLRHAERGGHGAAHMGVNPSQVPPPARPHQRGALSWRRRPGRRKRGRRQRRRRCQRAGGCVGARRAGQAGDGGQQQPAWSPTLRRPLPSRRPSPCPRPPTMHPTQRRRSRARCTSAPPSTPPCSCWQGPSSASAIETVFVIGGGQVGGALQCGCVGLGRLRVALLPPPLPRHHPALSSSRPRCLHPPRPLHRCTKSAWTRRSWRPST